MTGTRAVPWGPEEWGKLSAEVSFGVVFLEARVISMQHYKKYVKYG